MNSLSNEKVFTSSGFEDFDQEIIDTTPDDFYTSENTKKLRVEELANRYNINEKKLLWKLDVHVVFPFAIAAFISFLCRSNLGLLQIEGIYFSLEMTELSLFTAYALFFAPYFAFQFISNIILKRVRPHFWIALSVLLYGCVTLATAWVKTRGQFTACQFLHGLFQSGVETAMYYILAQYYEPSESQKRFGGIYSVQCLAGAVSTAITYAIDTTLINKYHRAEWRWLLIIEGSMAIVSSVILFFIIPDFPENARFIDEDETSFLVKKLEIYQGKSGFDLEVSNKELFSMFVDPVVLLPAMASLGICYATYCYAFFEPIFLTEIMGSSIANVNKMSVFPWICAFVYGNFIGYLSDKLKMRFPFVVLNLLLTLVGGALAFSHPLSTVPDYTKYSGLFLIVSGSYAATPLLICWATTNLGGHTRKNLGITMTISFGSLSGLVCIFPFLNDNPHRYTKGFSTGFGFLLLSLGSSIAYFFVLRSANLKKRTNDYKMKFGENSQRKQIILGDRNPAFDYNY
ncbi:hypothetical protein DASC09_003200 [Saccharomycopsis crataegensis]|uniref:Major facilitator superfamily (MFS) profile domain-containing protein n=1 Tax=Saccharomycopsis crataegensis TaxID=43959 RepID=A0AAV5QDI0_9ASCO|nr:hypothetical protein DASC09_003200 [Saccharomycopsis crataegensis]